MSIDIQLNNSDLLIVACSRAENIHLLRLEGRLYLGANIVKLYNDDLGAGESSQSTPIAKEKRLFFNKCFKKITTIVSSLVFLLNAFVKAFLLFRRYKFKTLICATDVDVTSISVHLVWLARITNKVVIVAPFCISNHEELIYSASNRALAFSSTNTFRFINKFLLGSWIWFSCERMYFHPYFLKGRILQIFGIFSGNPWIPCGGKNHIVAVESLFEKDYFIANGVSSESIIVLNTTSKCSPLPAVCNKPKYHKKNRARPFIVWSPCPDYLENKYFCDYNHYIRWHLYQFSLLCLDVHVSLHPRLSEGIIEDHFHALNADNIYIADRPVDIAVINASLFVCSNSSSAKYALRNHVFVLNFDFGLQQYSEYVNIKPVRRVETDDQFVSFLEAFSSDVDKFLIRADEAFAHYPAHYFG